MAGDRDNSVVITGNLARDPELRFGQSGNPFLNLSVAVNKSKKNPDGTWDNEGMFFEVRAFGDLAENAASSLQKGNRITVTGRLDMVKWTEKVWEMRADGQFEEVEKNRSKTILLADDISASFKWATGTIQRTERREGGNFGGGNNRGGGGYSAPAPTNDVFDEEPF